MTISDDNKTMNSRSVLARQTYLTHFGIVAVLLLACGFQIRAASPINSGVFAPLTSEGKIL